MTKKDMNVMEALAPPHPPGPSPRSPHLAPRLAPLGIAGLGPFVSSFALPLPFATRIHHISGIMCFHSGLHVGGRVLLTLLSDTTGY